MSPQQLLRETQRAAGDPRLTNWHDTLIVAGKEMAQLAEVCTALLTLISGPMCTHFMLKVLNSEKQQLKTLEDRNAVLERDVQRFNERKEFERQVGISTRPLPLCSMATSDCASGTYSPFHGIHGSEAALHGRENKSTCPP